MTTTFTIPTNRFDETLDKLYSKVKKIEYSKISEYTKISYKSMLTAFFNTNEDIETPDPVDVFIFDIIVEYFELAFSFMNVIKKRGKNEHFIENHQLDLNEYMFILLSSLFYQTVVDYMDNTTSVESQDGKITDDFKATINNLFATSESNCDLTVKHLSELLIHRQRVDKNKAEYYDVKEFVLKITTFVFFIIEITESSDGKSEYLTKIPTGSKFPDKESVDILCAYFEEKI